MGQGTKSTSYKYKENLFSAISIGFFFIVVGGIFAYTTFVTRVDLFNAFIDFFRDIKIVDVPNIQVNLPGPENPGMHSNVYNAVANFGLIWGIFQILILTLRFALGSPSSKKAEATSDVAFWLGVYFLISMGIVGITGWFVFWAQLIMLVGVTLIIRAIVLAIRP
ncbi:MAG: hypothetical protein PVF96_06100 [Candidatus Bathyarchaeota archaeon]|jgi:hypothetical protein